MVYVVHQLILTRVKMEATSFPKILSQKLASTLMNLSSDRSVKIE